MARLTAGFLKKILVPLVMALITAALPGSGVFADESTVRWVPSTSERSNITGEIRSTAKSRTPMLSHPNNLPPKTRELLGRNNDTGVGVQAYGSGGHPFTTKRAGAAIGEKAAWLKSPPWSGIGKLWVRFGSGWYVCTASVIEKGLIVTAAHCVHDFGEMNEGWADEVVFEPARHRNRRPLKSWNGIQLWIPTVYWNGTDNCTEEGVVCENDVAIVVLKKKGRVYVSRKSGHYDYGVGNYGYTDFLGVRAAQITQLGYPVDLDGGLRMIRTDSLGYQDDPNNVVIGSDQTGGASGGPWFVNFGVDYNSNNSTPEQQDMRIIAVTSWGYTDSNVKILGGSRFARNSTFKSRPNIVRLLEDVCFNNPDYCY